MNKTIRDVENRMKDYGKAALIGFSITALLFGMTLFLLWLVPTLIVGG